MRSEKVILCVFALLCITLTGLYSQGIEDVDGNIYLTVKIGDQIWMAEDLKTTKFNDGKLIPLVTDSKKWQNLKTPAYCWLDNIAANKYTYGALYNWYTVNTKKICPQGWHVPSNIEWKTMIYYIKGMNRGGDMLKERGLAHWKNNSDNVTNQYGFTALPSGYRRSTGTFPGDSYAVWWTSTEYSPAEAWVWGLNDVLSSVFNGYEKIKSGFSIRCIKE